MKNNIYLLKDASEEGPDYDEFRGFIIITSSAKKAREMASAIARRKEFWLSSRDVKVTLLGTSDLAEQIALDDFNAG